MSSRSGGREENKGWAAQKHGAGSAAAQQRAAAHTPPAPPPVLSPLSLQPPRSSPTPQPPVNVAPGLSCLALGLLFVLGAPLSPNLLLATGFPFQLDLKDPWLCPLSDLGGDLEAPRPWIELPKQRTGRCRARPLVWVVRNAAARSDTCRGSIHWHSHLHCSRGFYYIAAVELLDAHVAFQELGPQLPQDWCQGAMDHDPLHLAIWCQQTRSEDSRRRSGRAG